MPSLSKKYYHNIDLDNNQLISAVIENRSSAPTYGVDGQIYFNTVDKTIYYYNAASSQWQQLVGSIGGTGTVTSVSLSAPLGFIVSGSPITSAGTLTFSFAAGYSLPAIASQNNWDTAYAWGNHATAGYLISYTETDPTVPAYVKAITNTQITNWNTAYSWGDHSSAGYQLTSQKGQVNGYASLDGTGKVPLTQISITTTNVSEGNNLYYTDARARAAVSVTTTGTSGVATYNSSTGVLNIPNYQGLVPSGGTIGQILAKIDATNYNTEWIDNYTSSVKHLVKLGENMTKGTPVYVSSADGTNMVVSKASYTGEGTSSKTFGILAESGSTNNQRFVITEGLLAGLNTSGAIDGDPIWLGPNGTMLFGLANKPVAPNHLVLLGFVTRAQTNNGEIFVKIQNGFEIEELHNVLITTVQDKHILYRDAATSLWKNSSISTVLGYTPANAATTITINGVSYDLSANRSWTISGGSGSGTVTTISIVSANGFAGTVADASTTPAITLTTTITGLLKGNGTAISAAVAGTDYQVPISLTTTGNSGAATFSSNTLNIPNYTLAGLGGQPSSTNLTSLAALSYVSMSFVKMTAAGTFSLDTNTYLTGNQNITLSGDLSGSGTTSISATIANQAVTYAKIQNVTDQRLLGRSAGSAGTVQEISIGSGLQLSGGILASTSGGGSVTAVSVVSANGFAGTVANASSTPAITLTTTVTGLLKGNGTAISAAVANTDYLSVDDPLYTGTLSTGSLSFGPQAANPLMALESSVNSYNQSLIQNSNAGAQASSDIIVNNDQSTDTTFYGDYGINSSNYTGQGSFNLPNAVYLYSASSELVLGTVTNNSIHFVINAGASDAAIIKTNRQFQLPAYTTSTSFTGTAVGYLGYDSSGNVISLSLPVENKYTIINITSTHNETATSGTKIIKADTTSGAFSINLPSASGNGATIIIKKTAGTASLTVDGAGSQTIDGGLNAVINRVDESITLVSDNSNWLII